MFRGLPRRAALRAARSHAGRLVAILLGIALVVGILRGGSHYLYCPFMDAVVAGHCCPELRDSASTIEAPDCCESMSIGMLPSASGVSTGPIVPAASIVAVVPAARGIAERLAPAHAASFGPSVTGPPSLAGSARAARLMVFLI